MCYYIIVSVKLCEWSSPAFFFAVKWFADQGRTAGRGAKDMGASQ